MFASRLLRWALVGAGAFSVLAAAWVTWQAWQVQRDLGEAVDHANAFRAALENGDDAAAERELAALRDSSGTAADRTSGSTWSLVTHVPVVGDDAAGVRVASEAVHILATEGLESLLAVSNDLDVLLPRDGGVPIDAIHELEGPVVEAHAAIARAEALLSAEDSSGYADSLKVQYRDLLEQVTRANDAMASAETAIDVLPEMLGEDEPQRFLLVFENNAEIRATGGLPGTVAVVQAVDGQLSLERQVAIASLGRAEQPVLPLTDPERKLYDDVPAVYLQSSNMTPDVPRAADLMRARWAEEYPRDRIDGVILVDTVTLGYVLDATGPVVVDDVELTGDTLVEELLHGTYLRLPGQHGEQDAFYDDVTSAAFDRFTTGLTDGTGLVRALADAAGEGRVFVHSFDPAVQEQLAGTAIAGELITDPANPAPQVNVTLNDTTGSKMSYFLRYDVDVDATYCGDDRQGLSGSARLWSVAPADAAQLPDDITGGGITGTPRGRQVVTVRVYGPVGGTVKDFKINAEPARLIRVDQDGRPVGMTYIELGPGETVDVSWEMTSGGGQTEDAELAVTPGLEPGSLSRRVPSPCA